MLSRGNAFAMGVIRSRRACMLVRGIAFAERVNKKSLAVLSWRTAVVVGENTVGCVVVE